MSKDANENQVNNLGYRYKLFNSINEVTSDDWNSVCQNSKEDLFMDLRFISTVESTMSQYSKFWHVIFYDNEDVPVACTSLCRFDVDLFIFTNAHIKKAGNFFRSMFPSFMTFKILFCGLPVSIGQNHLRLTPQADHDAVMKILDQILQELAQSEKSWFIVLKEFNSESCERMSSLAELGYRRGESLPMHNFNPRFSDFAEYCSSLKSHYRYDIKRSMRKFKSAGLKVVRLTDSNQIRRIYVREAHNLYEAVVAKSENKLEILPMEFFHELSRQFPEQMSYTLAYQGNQIVAFNCALYSNTSYHFLFCGLNYELSPSADIYFNIMYSDLDNALKHGGSIIQVGQTADKFKARLGCFQESLYVYIKGTSKLPHYFLKLFFNIIFPAQKKHASNRIIKQENTSIKLE